MLNVCSMCDVCRLTKGSPPLFSLQYLGMVAMRDGSPKRACPVYKVYLIVDPAKTGPVTFIMLSSYRSDPKSVEIDAPDDYLVEYVVVAA